MGYRGEEPDYEFVAVKIIAMSKKAAYCDFLDYDDEKIWVPFVVMEDEGVDLKKGDEVDLSVARWFLKKNGIDTD